MADMKPLTRFKVPLTGQEIELQELAYEGGNMAQLRVRIRERTRFTTVDVDPLTARRWGALMTAWADGQPAAKSRATDE